MQITRTSIFSGVTRTLELAITENQLQAWQAGQNIEQAMPTLTPADREFVMTGVTGEEWQTEFSEDDFEDDD
jgi:hypothetical protein